MLFTLPLSVLLLSGGVSAARSRRTFSSPKNAPQVPMELSEDLYLQNHDMENAWLHNPSLLSVLPSADHFRTVSTSSSSTASVTSSGHWHTITALRAEKTAPVTRDSSPSMTRMTRSTSTPTPGTPACKRPATTAALPAWIEEELDLSDDIAVEIEIEDIWTTTTTTTYTTKTVYPTTFTTITRAGIEVEVTGWAK